MTNFIKISAISVFALFFLGILVASFIAVNASPEPASDMGLVATSTLPISCDHTSKMYECTGCTWVWSVDGEEKQYCESCRWR